MRNPIWRSVAVLLVGAAVALPLQQVAPAAAAVTSACGPSTAIYGVNAAGELREWLDSAPAVSGGVSAVAAVQRPTMGGFARLIAGGNGVVYAIDPAGHLFWYRHLGAASGQASWDPASGKEIGHGWTIFTKVVSGGDGTLYGVDATGQVRWYRQNSYLTGGTTFAVGSGTVVATGWGSFVRVVAGGLGTFYVTDAGGFLRWYHHDGWITGRAVWRATSGAVVGNGWTFPTLLSAGGGILLGVSADGSVRWYNHLGALDGSKTWAAGNGAVLTGINLAGLANPTADPMACSPLDRASLAGVQTVASEMVAGRGFAATEYACLNNVALKESSWRWNAGSVAGAYGIPQAQPGTKMAISGADWQTNPVTQINWMLDYVVSRYKTPCGAWTFWSAHGYY